MPKQEKNTKIEDQEKESSSKKNMFKAFSKMKAASLFDPSKAKALQNKNMETMKQAQGIVSEMFKEISKMNSQYAKKNLDEMQSKMKDLVEKIQVSDALRQKAIEVKNHHSELVKKMKSSKASALENWNEKVEVLKQHHNKLGEKIKESKHSLTSKITDKIDVAKEHHKLIADSLHGSTKRIMELMKNSSQN